VAYTVTVKTGDVRAAGTDSKVFIILHGGRDGEETSPKIWLEHGKFERGSVDTFNINVPTMLSPLNRIEIGHDDSEFAPGWFLDSVTVR
jgi:hypothetical protein